MDGDIHFDARLSNYEDLSFTIQALSQCSSYVAIPAVNYIYRVNYDHDRTVDRIAKIYDLLGNTDIIAESFLQLEKAICEDIGDAKNLVLDLKGVQYISSAGLRVLLGAQKKMQKIGSMKVTNVCEAVMEVLEMTGFADILVIE